MLKGITGVLMAVLLASLRDVIHQIFLTLVGKRIVKFLVLSALEWLAKRTDNKVDDELVAQVKQALESKEQQPESNEQPPAK